MLSLLAKLTNSVNFNNYYPILSKTLKGGRKGTFLPLRYKRNYEKHENVKQDHQANIVKQFCNHKLSQVQVSEIKKEKRNVVKQLQLLTSLQTAGSSETSSNK